MNINKNNITKLIKQNIHEVDPSAEVILYGSRARGDEHGESDWDILILTNYPVSIHREKQFRHHLFDLELEVGEPFSTFVYSKNDWNLKMSITPFYKNVQIEGIRL
ncbi:MAG: nucleotidyltransferase domain-containing protein [Bacteroidales bacterium]|nr:nucleotidyltransferase domain-containing protein [Bacteroidales bacterium]